MGTFKTNNGKEIAKVATTKDDLDYLDAPVMDNPWPAAESTYKAKYSHRHWKDIPIVAPPSGVVSDEQEKEWRRRLQEAESQQQIGDDEL